jgi:2-iminoacetate synthase
MCNFRRSNKTIIRKTMTINTFKKEVDALVKLKYSTIELVSGAFMPNTKIYDTFIDCMNYGKKVLDKNKITNFAFAVDALTQKEYLDFVDPRFTLIQWQETYDTNTYNKYLGSGQKSNMSKRIDAYEEWINAGGKKLGIGILAGLSDNFFEDVLMTIAHGKYLEQKYNISPTVIGIPRLQISNTNKELTLEGRKKISNKDLLKAIAIYRLCFPKANIVASTREPQNVIKNSLFVGATFTNYVCSTDIGNYDSLSKIINSNLPDNKKNQLLRDIQKNNSQQFFHPDPIFNEMKNTIEDAGKNIDFKKEF